VEKNRISGADCRVTVPFVWKRGLDYVGGMVDYLTDEKVWSVAEGRVKAAGFFKKALQREKLIRLIENDSRLTDRVTSLVERRWKEIEEKTVLPRRNRYA